MDGSTPRITIKDFARHAGTDVNKWQTLVGTIVTRADIREGIVKDILKNSLLELKVQVSYNVGRGEMRYPIFLFSGGGYFDTVTLAPASIAMIEQEQERLRQAQEGVQIEEKRSAEAAVQKAATQAERRRDSVAAEERRQAELLTAAIERRRIRKLENAATEERRKAEAEEYRRAAEQERWQRLYSPILRRMVREARCWACQQELTEFSPDKTPHGNSTCLACRWMLCSCGACRSPLNNFGGCDQQIVRLGEKKYEERIQERTFPTSNQLPNLGNHRSKRNSNLSDDLDEVPFD